MGDLLELSSRVIDTGVADEPVNRVTEELSELADDRAIVENFCRCVVLDTDGRRERITGVLEMFAHERGDLRCGSTRIRGGEPWRSQHLRRS